MRGKTSTQNAMFSYRSLEDRIPRRHPLRDIRKIVDRALKDLSPTGMPGYPRGSDGAGTPFGIHSPPFRIEASAKGAYN